MSALPPSSRFLCGLIALGCCLALPALAAPPPSERSAADAQALGARRSVHTFAKAAASRGDFAAAARALDAQSTAPAGSAARFFETAQKLTLLAGDLSRGGNGGGAQAAARTAL